MARIGVVSSLKCHGVSTSPTPWHCYVGIIKNTVILKYPLINKRFLIGIIKKQNIFQEVNDSKKNATVQPRGKNS